VSFVAERRSSKKLPTVFPRPQSQSPQPIWPSASRLFEFVHSDPSHAGPPRSEISRRLACVPVRLNGASRGFCALCPRIDVAEKLTRVPIEDHARRRCSYSAKSADCCLACFPKPTCASRPVHLPITARSPQPLVSRSGPVPVRDIPGPVALAGAVLGGPRLTPCQKCQIVRLGSVLTF